MFTVLPEHRGQALLHSQQPLRQIPLRRIRNHRHHSSRPQLPRHIHRRAQHRPALDPANTPTSEASLHHRKRRLIHHLHHAVAHAAIKSRRNKRHADSFHPMRPRLTALQHTSLRLHGHRQNLRLAASSKNRATPVNVPADPIPETHASTRPSICCQISTAVVCS